MGERNKTSDQGDYLWANSELVLFCIYKTSFEKRELHFEGSVLLLSWWCL